jgi:hypothetical protein
MALLGGPSPSGIVTEILVPKLLSIKTYGQNAVLLTDSDMSNQKYCIKMRFF